AASFSVELIEHVGHSLVRRRIVIVTGDVTEAGGVVVPYLLGVVAASAALLDHLAHPLAELVVGPLGPRHTDDGQSRRQQPAERQTLDGGHELAAREVARRSEHDDGARRRDAGRVDVDQRVLTRDVLKTHWVAAASGPAL